MICIYVVDISRVIYNIDDLSAKILIIKKQQDAHYRCDYTATGALMPGQGS